MKPSVVVAIALVISCGGGGGGDPDHVTVGLNSGTGPAAGITVLFHGADGAVLDRQVTGADGVARSAAAATTQVTISWPTGPGWYLYTYRGVGLGDVIDKRLDDYSELGEATVTLPGNWRDGASYWVASSSWGSTADFATPESMPLHGVDLHGSPPAFRTYAWAYDETTETIEAWSQADTPLSGPNVTMPAWSTAVDAATVETTTLPSAVDDLYLQPYVVVDGQSFELPYAMNATEVPFAYPRVDGAEAWGVQASYSVDLGTEMRFGGVDVRRPSQPDRIDVELAAVSADLTGIVLGPQLDRPALTWTGTHASADALIGVLGWSDGTDAAHAWLIYDGDTGANRMEAPIVPEDAGGPSATTDYQFFGVEVEDDDGVDGYGDILDGTADALETSTEGVRRYLGVFQGF